MANTTFTGDLEDLKALVEQCGIKGAWEVKDNGHHQYRSRDGAQLKWWATSGTVSYTAKTESKARLQAAVDLVFAAPASAASCRVVQPSSSRSSSWSTGTMATPSISWNWRSTGSTYSPSS